MDPLDAFERGDGFGLLLAFDRNDKEFALGFEVGRMWSVLSQTDENYEAEVHAANAEMMMRLAEATERTVESEELGDGWLTVRFSERDGSYQERNS